MLKILRSDDGASKVKMDKPLIAIVGPTASGKTALGVSIAKEYDGEIISADSRAIYKGLSIGTAKPTEQECEGVVHWGFDLVQPGDRFTAADFQKYAFDKIADIRRRGKLPILVGGTGLYVDAVLYDFEFSEASNDTKRRDELMAKSFDDLYEYCAKNNITLPENKKNKRHVVNAILRNGQDLKRKHKLDGNTLVVGIATEKEELRARIIARSKVIFDSGVIDEAVESGEKYGWESEAMTGNIYPLIHNYIEGKLTRIELEQKFATSDWRLAKRQLTWLRRNEHIYWSNREDAYKYVARYLDRLNNL